MTKPRLRETPIIMTILETILVTVVSKAIVVPASVPRPQNLNSPLKLLPLLQVQLRLLPVMLLQLRSRRLKPLPSKLRSTLLRKRSAGSLFRLYWHLWNCLRI
jgi:hypothetical protein